MLLSTHHEKGKILWLKLSFYYSWWKPIYLPLFPYCYLLILPMKRKNLIRGWNWAKWMYQFSERENYSSLVELVEEFAFKSPLFSCCYPLIFPMKRKNLIHGWNWAKWGGVQFCIKQERCLLFTFREKKKEWKCKPFVNLPTPKVASLYIFFVFLISLLF